MKTEGTKVPWGGWASPKPDAQQEPRRDRLVKSFWQEVGSIQKESEKRKEWIDLDELLQGWR